MQKEENRHERVERLAVGAKEASQMLGISERSLWDRVADGTIPTKRLGKRVLFPIDALRELMNVNTNQTEENEQ